MSFNSLCVPLASLCEETQCHQGNRWLTGQQSDPVQNGPRRDKICLRGYANNKGADQPAHQRRLTSACVIRLLESIISKLASSEISIF